MGQITITRRLEFDAGHRLMKHESKCRNVHGHRYVVEVSVAGPQLDVVGRVVDFSALKDKLGNWIDACWDHGFLYQIGDPIAQFLVDNGMKGYMLDVPPTAEHMVKYLANVAQRLLEDTPLHVTHMRLFETPNCWADYYP